MNKKYLALGIFVVITLGLLLWLAQNVGAIGSKKGDTYTVRLEHAAGIVEDNAVKIAGVKVGVVESVDVDHDIAVLTLRMEKEVQLHTDAMALVRAKSLLGEKYLQLDPGTVEAPVLDPGSEIDQVKETFEIDEVLNALQPLLGGDSSIAQSVAPLMERVDGLLAKAEGADGQPPIATREQLTQSVEDVTETIATLRRFVENNEEPMTELVDNANKVLSNPKIPRIISNLDRVASDSADRVPELLDKADSALTNVEMACSVLTMIYKKEYKTNRSEICKARGTTPSSILLLLTFGIRVFSASLIGIIS